MFQIFAKTTKQVHLITNINSVSKVEINVWRRILSHLLSISSEEATFARRGFITANPKAQQHLEQIGRTFLQGYHFAIAMDRLEVLIAQLNNIKADLRGFAFEGAAMGLMLLDSLTPWQRSRCQNFLNSTGANHSYMVYVGNGMGFSAITLGYPSIPITIKASR